VGYLARSLKSITTFPQQHFFKILTTRRMKNLFMLLQPIFAADQPKQATVSGKRLQA